MFFFIFFFIFGLFFSAFKYPIFDQNKPDNNKQIWKKVVDKTTCFSKQKNRKQKSAPF